MICCHMHVQAVTCCHMHVHAATCKRLGSVWLARCPGSHITCMSRQLHAVHMLSHACSGSHMHVQAATCCHMHVQAARHMRMHVVGYLEGLHMLEVVRIPTLDSGVFAGREEEVSVRDEPHRHYTVIMRKYGLVTITKIQTPDTNVLIRRRAHYQGAVLQDRQLAQ